MSFPKNFLWGAASAAYQIEGAYDEDGKVPGIWDALSAGHVKHGENGNIACYHYHRYKEDVALLKKLGVKAYRLSVSWPRVMSGPDTVNPKGLEFYSKLVDELKAAGIEPMVTIFHWNLPMWAYEKGGWYSEEISDDFANYVRVLSDALSDRVRYWFTVNEPATFIGNGYFTGMHAPFESLMQAPPAEMMTKLAALTKNVLLAHGKAVRVLRSRAKQNPQIGMALNGSVYLPQSESTADVETARALTFPEQAFFPHFNWWADPAVLGRVPATLQPFFTAEELKIACQPLDFFGFNCYNSSDYDEYTGPNPAVKPGMARTAMEWPVTPDALYWAARFLTERYHLPVMVTENGMANIDFVMSDGAVHDPQRIDFIKRYLTGLQRAVEENIPVIGYLYWSIMDNFEWAEGYDKRFGLIYVDYQTQQRIPKDSFYWYANVIKNNGLS